VSTPSESLAAARRSALRPPRPAPVIAGLGTPWQLAAVLALLGLGAVMALTVNGYWVFVLANVALLALVGIGLNVLIGLTGQVSFGHVGFYALGAYAVAILTTHAGWSFWAAWPLAAVLGAAAGALLALPALRVKGPYLAMITIAFGFIVEHAIVEAEDLTGGQNGIMGVSAPALGGWAGGERAMALIALAAAGVALAGYAWLARGTWGAAMRAVRDSDTAAESIGLNPLAIKTVAFAVSAACAAAAGGVFAPLSGFVTPHTFGFLQSILFVLVVMLGGAGSVIGPVLGALIVGLMPEWLASLEAYRLLLFGALMLGVLWVAPDGLAGGWRRWVSRRWPNAPAPEPEAVAAIDTLRQRVRQPLRADGLTMQFGGVRAVHALDLAVPPAAVTSLIGPNGAGKTTALNMLSGYYPPTAGGFRLGERPLAGLPPRTVARAGVARTYQTSQLFGSLSVLDNVALALRRGRLGSLMGSAHLRGEAPVRRARQLLAYCGYTGRGDATAADLPHVDRRLVEIARALATDPDALLLDEPAAGLSREDKVRLAILLRRIADAGMAVLLVEHDMALVMGISDQVVVLDAGERIAGGSPASVQADPAVQQAYLGESLEAAPETPARKAPADGRAELLGVNALEAGYGAEPVLHGIHLQVRRGEVVALLGPNGAGKSTLMKALAGLHRPVRGGVHVEGHDLTRLPAERVVALGVVLVPEGRQVFPELSVRDNIRLGAFLHPAEREARVESQLDRFPRLRERQHQRAGLLSGGEQQMLAIARALMSRPRVLLLVDQMAGLALALADRAYVIDSGRIVAQGTPAQIAADPALAQAYLGAQAGDAA